MLGTRYGPVGIRFSDSRDSILSNSRDPMVIFSDSRNPNRVPKQARNQGGEALLENFLRPLEKCVGHSLKLLEIVQKFWAPLRKLFAPPVVPSWLRAC